VSTYTAGLAPPSPSIAPGLYKPIPAPIRGAFAPRVGGSATTYYYRTSGGARGSTTDAGSIPAGAVVERVT
jgi:hypothetical protein